MYKYIYQRGKETASNIVPTTIDDTYPVAGQDNNSQGFRDNFNIIKTNFVSAKSEIEDLQTNTAKTNVDNNFFENTNSRYVKLQETATHNSTALSGITTDVDINFAQGHFFTVKAQADVALTFTGWPTNNEYGEIVVQVYGDGVTNRNITFNATYSSGITSAMRVCEDSEWSGRTITTNTVTTRSHLVKAFTYDNGATVFFDYLGTFTAAA